MGFCSIGYNTKSVPKIYGTLCEPFASLIIFTETCTFVRLSFAPEPAESPVTERDICSDDRATDDTADRFSDGRYLGSHRVGKGVFYVWPLDPRLLHRYPKQTSCSWTALAFAFALVNTDREELD